MRIRKGLLSGIAGLAAAAALALTPAAAFAAGGPPSGHGGGQPAGHGAGGGGGGKGGPPTTEAANNLSVPTVFIGGLGSFTLQNDTGDLVPPSGDPSLVTTQPDAEGIGPGYFYIQGKNAWQAQYFQEGSATATAKWGDNLLGGEASLKAGHPIRVEMGLTSTDVTGTGFNVYKLDDQALDRESAYGTPAESTTDEQGNVTYSGIPVPGMQARVWGPDATLSITAPDGQTATVAMPGEINATGAVVFGYNWRPSEPGAYTLTFNPPSGVTVSDTASLSIGADVTSSGGGGH